MPSFDVVSRTDLMEVDNAINGVRREIKQRFDLVGTKCAIDRTYDSLTMTADDSMKMQQLEDLLRKYLASRKVDQRSLEFKTPQDAARHRRLEEQRDEREQKQMYDEMQQGFVESFESGELVH